MKSANETTVYEALAGGPLTFDALLTATKVPIGDLVSALDKLLVEREIYCNSKTGVFGQWRHTVPFEALEWEPKPKTEEAGPEPKTSLQEAVYLARRNAKIVSALKRLVALHHADKEIPKATIQLLLEMPE